MSIQIIKPHQRGRGGKRAGAGRPADWLKAKCASIVDKKKLVEFVARVASGEETEPHVTKDGEVIDCAPSIHDRLKAVEMLLDRGFGKASSVDSNPLIEPLQKVINDTALLKMLYELNYPERIGSAEHRAILEGRTPPVQA